MAYTVKSGDTLSGIYGANWKQLSGYTGDPAKLAVGTELPDVPNNNIINSGSMSPTPQVKLVTPNPDTTNHVGIIAGSAADLQSKYDTAQANVDKLSSATSDTNNPDSVSSQILSLMGKENQKTADTQTANDVSGATALAKQLNDLNAQAKNLNLEAQAIPIQTQERNAGTGATDAGVAPQNAGALRQNALKALSLSQQANIATGNYTAAKDIAQRMVDLKYLPIENELATLKQQYEFNKDALTAADAKKADALNALITKRANDVATQKTKESNNNDVKVTWASNAYQAGQSDLAAKISQLDPASATFSADLAKLQSQVKLTPDQLYKIAQANALNGTPGETGTTTGAGTGAINVAATAGITDITIPLTQAIANVGIDAIVKGILTNEGGVPQGTNNPGNVKFANQVGATKGKASPENDGTYYANFDTKQHGLDAIANQIQIYAKNGDTFQDAINKYTNTYAKANAIGTTGSPAMDTTKPGYTTSVVAGTGISQSAIDQDALATILGQPLPVPLSKAGTGQAQYQKNAIANRVGEMSSGGNIAANKAQLKSFSNSLTTQQGYLDTTQRAFNTANDTLAALTEWMTKNGINPSQYPDVNKFNNYLKSKGIDPGAAGGYAAQIATLRAEYSQVLAKGGVRSVETDNEAAKLIPDGLSPAQLQTVADRIKVDGQNVVNDAQQQINKINGQINGIIGGVPGIKYPSDGSSFSVGGYNINIPTK